ncbi:UNVERIFIED_CONTAM: ATP-dependent DNA helicase PIF1 [Sesamum radiatum]|uniref:ATP-dependent DNA helicase n=1 Tax=Sesamum radiatum TaxID=300843 RepID=A0AAW2V5Z9_SESRA
MVDGKCSKHYPKKFSNQTTIDEDGFVSYRRRNNPSNTVIINRVEIDNRWIVPYNRDLLVLFNAHINVEKCASPKSTKYMYKYTYKGIDMATIVIENNADNPQNNGEHMYRHVDEIKQYLDCRYVSAIEACWRIYEFELQKQYPSVERLQYHLPNEQFVVFNEDDHLYDVVNRNGVQDTMLTKWFEANKKYPVARTLTYVQFPTAWVWKRDKKQWEMRKKGKCIEITDSFGLWERHWRVMTDDLQYRLRRELRDNSVHISDENLKEWGLHEIECILNRNGKTLGDFPPMPLPSSRSFGIITNRLIREELDYDSVAEEQSFRSYFNGLNNDQLRVFNAIIQAYERKCGGLFFVNGSGGTGKTYLWKTIIAKFRSQNKVVLSVASSGIAALLLPGGRTAHSRFKIPFELVETSHCPINLNTDLAHLIQEASLIIWDEAPMMHRYGFEALIDSTYPQLGSMYSDAAYLKERAILAPKNSDVDVINSMMLSMIPGEVRQFCSADTLCPGETSVCEQHMNPPELLHSIKMSGIPDHYLELKKGAPIILLRNLNQSLGLCNGTRLTVLKMGDKVLEARVITGSHIGEEVLIPRIVLTTTESQTFVPFKRRQFPVKLAFAMTINKSQGQTLNKVDCTYQIPYSLMANCMWHCHV